MLKSRNFVFTFSLVVITLLCSYTESFCQNFFRLNLQGKNIQKIFIAPDTTGDICFFYTDLNQYYFSITDTAGVIKRSGKMPRLALKNIDEEFLGATITPDNFYLFFSGDGVQKTYYAYQISRKDSSDKFVKEIPLARKDFNFIKAYTENGSLYILSGKKKTREIALEKYSGLEEKECHIFKSDKTLFSEIRKDFSVIKTYQTQTIELLTSARKLYANEPGYLTLTIDNSDFKVSRAPGATVIYDFILAKDTIVTYYIPGDENDFRLSNSFLYHDTIYQVRIGGMSLSLYLFEMKTGKLIKEFTYDKGTFGAGDKQTDALKNNSLDIVTDKAYCDGKRNYLGFEKDEETITDRNKILRALGRGAPAIGLKKTDNKITILIGSQFQAASGGGYIPGSPSVATPYGVVPGSPGMNTPGSVPFDIITWFYSAIDPKTLSIISGFKKTPEFYSIDKFRERKDDLKKIEPGVIRVKENIFLSFWIKKEGLLKIYKIE